MYKSLLLFLVLLISTLLTFSQRTNYFQLTGKIGPYPVTLNLHQFQNQFSGTYYYNAYSDLMEVTGTINEKTSVIELHADEKEIFTLVDNKTNWQGIWNKNDKKYSCILNIAPLSQSFGYWVTKGEVKMPEPDGNQGTCDWSTVWPKGNDILSTMVKEKLIEPFPNHDQLALDQPPANLLTILKKKYLDGYRNDMIVSKPDYYNQSLNITNRILFNTDKYLCIESDLYDYSGGAHGNYYSSYFNFNKSTHQYITLNTLFTEDGMALLPSLIESQYRKQNQIKSNQSLTSAGLLVEHFTDPAETFWMTPKGIHFVYNRYEIAPYTAGSIEVFLPFQQFRSYLKYNYQSLF